MDHDELIEFQKIFDSVDTSDPLKLRQWFEEYPELTLHEHCQIAGRTKATIKKWIRKARVNPIIITEIDGSIITSTRRRPLYIPDSKPLPNINIPDDWDTKPEWLLKCNEELGISKRQLSKLLNCSRHKIGRLINKTKEPPIPQSIVDLLNEL